MIVPEDWEPTSPMKLKKADYYIKDKEYVEGYRISSGMVI